MQMSSDSTMDSDPGMLNTLFSSTSTPLYSISWTPSSTGKYAGTCIFLIVLAFLFRALGAYKSIQERRWRDDEREARNKRPILVSDKSEDDEANLNEKNIGAGKAKKAVDATLWRISIDVPRALLDTVVAGVGYLLMLAVMTMNIGYFLSVLGGVFLGSLAFGRYGVHFSP